MGKGAQTSTQTTINPSQAAQAPFLKQGWEGAQNLYTQNQQGLTPYSSLAPTLASWGQPQRIQAYNDLYNAGQGAQGLNASTQGAYNTAVSGGYGGANNPAYGGYQGYAEGTAPALQNFGNLQGYGLNASNVFNDRVGQYAAPTAGLAGQAGANNNLGLSQLGRTASGEYLNSNPAFTQSVIDPITRNYQTAVAPSIDAAYSTGGRYGSGAMAGSADTAQRNLVKGISDAAATNFARERGLQDSAAQQYGTLYNQGLQQGVQGYQNAAGIQNQAANQYYAGLGQAQNAAQQQMQGQQAGLAGLSGIWNQGNAAALQAMGQFPQIAAGMGTGARMGAEGGAGLAGIQQAAINAEQQKWQEAQNAPYDALNRYMQSIGSPVGGSETKQTPYYNNPLAGVGSALSGIAGLATAFSDRRLKEDDQVVGQIGDLPIHTFKYKGDPTPRIGFMADEVDPKAVTLHPSGYKAVNYDKALTSALNSFRKR